MAWEAKARHLRLVGDRLAYLPGAGVPWPFYTLSLTSTGVEVRRVRGFHREFASMPTIAALPW